MEDFDKRVQACGCITIAGKLVRLCDKHYYAIINENLLRNQLEDIKLGPPLLKK